MTLNELKKEVLALGFETEFESESVFENALRRALCTIYTERAHCKTAVIRQSEIKPIFYIDKIYHKNEPKIFAANAKAYSFITDGNGIYILKDADGKKTFSFNGRGKLHRGFIIGCGEIQFLGNYSYTVHNLSLYDEILSSDVSDIPFYGENREYKMSDIAPDFLAFSGYAFDLNGKPIKNAVLKDGTVFLPSDFSGTAYITYKTAPRLEGLSGDTVIPISEECVHLLPLLISAYAWLDDDTEKSSYYMSLYREGMAAVKVYNRREISSTYTDVTGW